jgi:hypothetical protein
VIIDFDISDWHDKAVEIARKLEADGQWEAGLTDQLLALEP